MIKRAIGGVIFVVIFYLSIMFNFFELVAGFFLVFGIYELIQAYIKTDKLSGRIYVILYAIIFLLGVDIMEVIYLDSAMVFAIVIGLVMLNDTFAYLLGRRFGKKHFSKISPNKTVEGALGGLIISFALYLIYLQLPFSIAVFSATGILLFIQYTLFIVFAILGDLLESKLKRNANIKDSGTIIYGHGGVLDRIDSWVFAIIAIYLFL